MDAVLARHLVLCLLSLNVHVLHPVTHHNVLVHLLDDQLLYCRIYRYGGFHESDTLQRRKESGSESDKE